MPSPLRRPVAPYEAAAWRAPSSRRFQPTAANDNDAAVVVPRDPTRPSPLVGLIAAGALAVVLVAMMAGVL